MEVQFSGGIGDKMVPMHIMSGTASQHRGIASSGFAADK
jgi:hypothetical protein